MINITFNLLNHLFPQRAPSSRGEVEEEVRRYLLCLESWEHPFLPQSKKGLLAIKHNSHFFSAAFNLYLNRTDWTGDLDAANRHTSSHRYPLGWPGISQYCFPSKKNKYTAYARTGSQVLKLPVMFLFPKIFRLAVGYLGPSHRCHQKLSPIPPPTWATPPISHDPGVISITWTESWQEVAWAGSREPGRHCHAWVTNSHQGQLDMAHWGSSWTGSSSPALLWWDVLHGFPGVTMWHPPSPPCSFLSSFVLLLPPQLTLTLDMTLASCPREHSGSRCKETGSKAMNLILVEVGRLHVLVAAVVFLKALF